MWKLKLKIDNACHKILTRINKAKKGDVAFEYVIILVIMAAVIFLGWRFLGSKVLNNISHIGETMDEVGSSY